MRPGALAIACLLSTAVATSSSCGERDALARERRPWTALSGGRHLRITTATGPVHLWRPAGYARETAGIVVYVHGYFTDVDTAFSEHRLADQFSASRQNALFIVPEAPSKKTDEVRWPELGALLHEVEREGNVRRPDGPLVVVGHSGAYRTIVEWLEFRRVDEVILLDALYAHEDAFFDFVARGTGHKANKLIIVSVETKARANALLDRFPLAVRRSEIKEAFRARRVHRAQLVGFESGSSHMELVTRAKALPLLLRLTPLSRVVGP